MGKEDEEQYGYCWQCWRTRAGAVMYGMGGQLAVMCPDKNALLSTIADTWLDSNGLQKIYNAFFEDLYPFLDQEDMAPLSLALRVHALPGRGENLQTPYPGWQDVPALSCGGWV